MRRSRPLWNLSSRRFSKTQRSSAGHTTQRQKNVTERPDLDSQNWLIAKNYLQKLHCFSSKRQQCMDSKEVTYA
eukprot:5871526-Amphidinium_carterae.1